MPVNPNDFEPVQQVNPNDFAPVPDSSTQPAPATQPVASTQQVDPNDFAPVPDSSTQPAAATQSATAPVNPADFEPVTTPNSSLSFNDADMNAVRHIESADGKSLVGPPVKTKAGIERAVGPYQILPSTAAGMGLSNPFDETSARPAAANYLTSMAQEFGSKDLALAGYNWGPNNVKKLIAKYGSDAEQHLPQDVKAYIQKWHAANSEQSSVNPDDFEPVPSTTTPTTQATTQPQPASGSDIPDPNNMGIGSLIPNANPPNTPAPTTPTLLGDIWNGTTKSDTAKAIQQGAIDFASGTAGYAGQVGYLGEHLLLPAVTGAPTLHGLQDAGDKIGTVVQNYLEMYNQTGQVGRETSAKLQNAMSYVNKPTDWLGDTVTKAGDPNAGAWIKAVGPLVTQTVVGWALPKGLGFVTDAAKTKILAPLIKQKVDSTVELAKTGQGMPIDRTAKNADGTGMVVPTITSDEFINNIKESPKEGEPVQGNLQFSPNQKAFPEPVKATPEAPPPEPEAPPPPPTQEAVNLLNSIMDHTESGEEAARFNPNQEALDLQGGKMNPPKDATQIASDAAKAAMGPKEASVSTPEVGTEDNPRGMTPQEKAILDASRDQNLYVQRGNYGPGDMIKLVDGTYGKIKEMAEGGTRAIIQVGNELRSVLPTQIEFRIRSPHAQPIDEVPKPTLGPADEAKATPPENKGVGVDTPGPFPRLGKNQVGAVTMNWANTLADKIRGLTNFKLGKEPVKPQNSVFYTPQELVKTLHLIFHNSLDRDDFKLMLGHELDRNGAMPQVLRQVMDHIYDFFDKGNVPKTDPYFNLTEMQQRAANSAMPYETMRPSWGKLDPAKDDVSPVRENTLPSEFAGSLKWGRAGTKAIKWFVDNARVFTDLANYMSREYLKFGDFFNSLPRFSKLNVAQAMHDWDLGGKLNQMLIDNKQQYPTIEQLMQHSGLNRAEAVAYDSIAKGYQALFKLMRNVDQIPGYMPHMWHGSWKFQVIDHDGSLLAVHRTLTRYGAEIAGKEWREKGYNTTPVEAPTEVSKSDMARDLFQAASLFRKQKGLDLAARNRIDAIQRRIAEGTVYESMERHGIKGYTGTDGILPESGQGMYRNIRNWFDNNRMLKVYQMYTHDIITGWKNQHIIEKVLKPISDDATLDQLPHTKKALEDITQKAVGLSKTEMDPLDKVVNHLLVHIGASPDIPRRTVIALNAYTRLKTINSLNVKFAAQHLLFSLYALPNLLTEHIDLLRKGEKTGNLTGAITRYMETFVPGSWRLYDDVAQKARDRFESDGLETHMYEETSSGDRMIDMMKHGLLNTMVNHARRATFDTHFQYFREYMTPEQAYQAAKKATNKVMQSFDPLDRPGFLTEGNVGRMFAPFNQIHFYNLGRLLSATESLTEGVKAGVKTKDTSQAIRGFVPIMSLLGTGLFISGTRSAPFVESYNKLSKFLDEKYGMSMLSVDSWMKMHGYPDQDILGFLSHKLDTDLSGTFEGFDPVTALSSSSLGVAGSIGELLMQEILQYTRGFSDIHAKQAALKRLLPAPLNQWFTHELAKQTNGVIQNSRGEPTYRQTQAEYYHDLFLGGKTYTEAQKQLHQEVSNEVGMVQKNQAAQLKKAIIDKELSKQGGTFVNQEMFNPGSASPLSMIKQGVPSGLNPDTIEPGVQKALEERQHTAEENLRKRISTAISSGNTLEASRLVRNYKYIYGKEYQ